MEETNWLDILRDAAMKRNNSKELCSVFLLPTYAQTLNQTTIVGTGKNALKLIENSLRAGYGCLPAAWGIKLYMRRN